MPEHSNSRLRDLAPTMACPDDASDIADLRTQLVAWMLERGIDQWHQGEVGQARIEKPTAQREWWLTPYAGHQLGQRLLDWSADHGRTVAAELLRLDCVATNTDLCAYYLRQGFTRVGTKQLPGNWGMTALFERPINANV